MTKVRVCRIEEFTGSTRKIFEVGEIELAVFRLDDDFFAYLNECPHMGGPACQGKIIAQVEEIIAPGGISRGLAHSKTKLNVTCPWHGFEFDIRTGVHVGNSRFRLKKLSTFLEDGFLVVAIPNTLPGNPLWPRNNQIDSHRRS